MVILSSIPHSLPTGRQAKSAMHHARYMAALNLTWFRAHKVIPMPQLKQNCTDTSDVEA